MSWIVFITFVSFTRSLRVNVSQKVIEYYILSMADISPSCKSPSARNLLKENQKFCLEGAEEGYTIRIIGSSQAVALQYSFYSVQWMTEQVLGRFYNKSERDAATSQE